MNLTYKKDSNWNLRSTFRRTCLQLRANQPREAPGRSTQNSKVSQALFLSKLKDKLRHTAGIEDELLQMCGLTPG